jgi:hypothetical protein
VSRHLAASLPGVLGHYFEDNSVIDILLVEALVSQLLDIDSHAPH